ncbi:uncharacterized protein [Cicer arietinum]|uniref:Uncharacterized protein LOC105852861 n=1 Tax=Cicer arietinum TaxID=3827 RepID=A0A1S3EJG0_CICAR|nr:uncharacterized protein LOC105852861 [Cicer arietinum]
MRRGLRQGDPLFPFLFLIAAEGMNALFSAFVEANRFKGFKVDSNEFCVSILQFANDTLIMGDKCWDNIRAIKANLLWFEFQSGLKILNCKMGCVPFKYLGLPIGDHPRRKVFWKPVIEKIRNRLAGWNSRTLSMGGRLVLLKAVLFVLPKIRKFRGAIRWGLCGGRIFLREELVLKMNGLIKKVFKIIGNWNNTLFWKDSWLVGGVLREKFSRLFHLSLQQEENVEIMVKMLRREGIQGWRLRRQLFAWEEELMEQCRILLATFICKLMYLISGHGTIRKEDHIR